MREKESICNIAYIAVEGVIGAGKTSLAKKIKERLNSKLILEQFDVNPFLEKFYVDRKRYAFQTQMFFLVNRYKQQEELIQEELFTEYVVSDYILEKDRIFAYLNLSGEELSEAYNHFFFRYNSTPLLIVDSTEIDFVNVEVDFEELFQQIFREDRGVKEYFKPESKKVG